MKIITFNIGESLYGVIMDNIKEIMPYPTQVAKLPSQRNDVIGVCNLRGCITTILDINKLCNVEDKPKKFLIHFSKGESNVSFPTETIPQTLDADLSEIDEIPFAGDLVKGIVKTKIGLVILLDDEKLFNPFVKI